MTITKWAHLLTCGILLIASLAHAEHPVQLHKDIEWASGEGYKLTADIYVPKTETKQYPVLVILHGGGWLLNTNAVMNDMANYLASNAELVVVNANYRRLVDMDNTVKMNQIVEDAMGAVVWVQHNIAKYLGNPKQVAITGDSAGGHLAATVLLAGAKLESDGFSGKTLGFNPTYLPPGITADQLASQGGIQLQAAVLSYPALDIFATAQGGFEAANNPWWQWAGAKARGLFGNDATILTRPDYYKAVSPMYLVPQAKEAQLPPQFVLVGSDDPLTTPDSMQGYLDKLKEAQQPFEFKVYPGKSHAFLDSGCSQFTKVCFEDAAIPTLKDIIAFLNKALH